MAATVRPFLMFEGKAEEAMNFYVSVIPRSEVIDIVLWVGDRFGVSWQLNLA